MDPYKGGILQSVITFFLNIVLYIFYGFLKIAYLFKKEEEFIEPSHVIQASDTVVVVLVPESGDDIQMMKAGLMEIADIFTINK